MLVLVPFVVCQFVFFLPWDIKAMFDISINLGYKVRPWNGGLVFDSYSAPIAQRVAIYNALHIFGVEVAFLLLFYFYLWVFPRRFSTIQTYSRVSLYEFSLSRPLNVSFIEFFLSCCKLFLPTGHQVLVIILKQNLCLQPFWDNMITILTIPAKYDVTLSIGGANKTGWI